MFKDCVLAVISILISELFLHNFQFLKTQTKIPSESLVIDFKKEETKLAIIYNISKNYFSFEIMPKNLERTNFIAKCKNCRI